MRARAGTGDCQARVAMPLTDRQRACGFELRIMLLQHSGYTTHPFSGVSGSPRRMSGKHRRYSVSSARQSLHRLQGSSVAIHKRKRQATQGGSHDIRPLNYRYNIPTTDAHAFDSASETSIHRGDSSGSANLRCDADPC